MAWVRIDENFPQHPKVATVGPLGMALQVAGLCYCNRNLTDGFIPWAVAQTLLSWEFLGPEEERGAKRYRISVSCGMVGDDVATDFVIGLLLEHGIWEQVEGGYQIHDYADYQPTKAEILAEREQKRRAGSLGGQASARARARAPAQAEAKQMASTCSSKTQAEFKPDPDPDPDPVSDPSKIDPAISKTVADQGGVGGDDSHTLLEHSHDDQRPLVNADADPTNGRSIRADQCSKKPKVKYAEFVSMTETEYASLVARLGSETRAKRCIEILDNYKGAHGRRYKSDYRAILQWVIDRLREEEARAAPRRTLDDYEDLSKRREMLVREANTA